MHILITGGAGFIGSNLAALAIEHGITVTVLDDLSTGFEANLNHLNLRLIRGSILDPDLLQQALEGVDSVVHLAALGSVPRSIRNPMATNEVNVTGTLRVLNAAKRAGIVHFVVASSSSVYGLNPSSPKNERNWVRPLSPYAVTKLAAEQYVLAYQQSFAMKTLAFRLFNVYGPNQRAGQAYAAVIPVFIDALINCRPLPVNSDGNQSRDFTFVRTVCHILLEAVTNCVSYAEPVNLAYGTNTTLNQLVHTLGEITEHVPAVEYHSERPGDVRHSCADKTILQTLFPNVNPVRLEQGLKETIRWFEGSK